MKQNRWYDKDPVVRAAVNMLEKASPQVKDRAADYIIEKSKNSGYVLVVNNYEYFWQRWQDNNVKHFLAMEYLKIVDDETKREICAEVVKFIEAVNAQGE